jgi:hypothetical protein
VKERYEKPEVESESAFEALALGCTYINASEQTSCDPDWFGQELRS